MSRRRRRRRKGNEGRKAVGEREERTEEICEMQQQIRALSGPV